MTPEEVRQITAARWRELYLARGSGWPSIRRLAAQLGVCAEVVRDALHAAQTPVRSRGEQARRDYETGVQQPRGGGARPAKPAPWLRSVESNRKRAETQSRRSVFRCSWCGKAGRRKSSELGFTARRPWAVVYCNRSCAQFHRAFCRREGEDAPRPILLAALVKRAGTAPRTYERLMRLAEEVGAGENEVFACLL